MSKKYSIILSCIALVVLMPSANYFAFAQVQGTVPTPTAGPTPTPSPTLPPTPQFSCSPTPQTVYVNQLFSVQENISGGQYNANWSAPGAVTTEGYGTTFQTMYATIGNKTITANSVGFPGGEVEATCAVNVIVVPDPTPTAGPTPTPSPTATAVPNTLPVGVFEEIDGSGVASGWTYDPNSPATSIVVRFYLDGTTTTGTNIGQVTANVSRPDINSTYGITGNHGFEFTIPAQYQDGVQHALRAYARDANYAGWWVLLTNSPINYTLGSLPSPTPSPVPCVGVAFPENFDGVVAPNLPDSWQAVNVNVGGGAVANSIYWTTSNNSSDTVLNNAFVANSGTSTDKQLISPGVYISSTSPILSFRNNHKFESSGATYFDGGVLEISSPNINGGAFTDITNESVGGTFIEGGYVANVDTGITSNRNPIKGRPAWVGDSGGYINSSVHLGPHLEGQIVYLRFRMGTNNTGAAPGWRIDTITLAGGGSCDVPVATPTLAPTQAPTPTPTLSCNADWELNLDYPSADAVRNGTVDFTLSLPGTSFGHVPNNPSIVSGYQYPDIPVAGPTMSILSGTGAEDSLYSGTIQMASADAVAIKFDLWCSDPAGEFHLVRTYNWTVEQSPNSIPPRSPTGVTSDIRYVSLLLMVDADVARDPLGVTLESQVQLRNLKSNL